MKYRKDEEVYKDPVCGMEVSRISAIAETEHDGKTYYFCAGICKEAFESDPEKYLNGKHSKQVRMS